MRRVDPHWDSGLAYTAACFLVLTGFAAVATGGFAGFLEGSRDMPGSSWLLLVLLGLGFLAAAEGSLYVTTLQLAPRAARRLSASARRRGAFLGGVATGAGLGVAARFGTPDLFGRGHGLPTWAWLLALIVLPVGAAGAAMTAVGPRASRPAA